MKYIRPGFFRATVLGSAAVIILAVAFSVSFSSGPAFAGGKGGVCDSITMDTLTKHTPIPKAEIISKRDVFGICEIMLQIGTEIVPVYVTDRYVIAGEMFADRKQITRETQEKLEAKAAEGMKTVFLGMKDDLAKSASIVYTPKGKVKQRLFMFGTTQCPWCSKAAKETQHVSQRVDT